MNLLPLLLHGHRCRLICCIGVLIHEVFLDFKLHILVIERLLIFIIVLNPIFFDRTKHQVLIVLHFTIVGENWVSKITVSFDGVNREDSCVVG